MRKKSLYKLKSKLQNIKIAHFVFKFGDKKSIYKKKNKIIKKKRTFYSLLRIPFV